MRRYRRPDYRNGSKPTNVVDITSAPKFLEVDGRSRDNLIDRWRSLVFAPLSPAGFGLALVSRPVFFSGYFSLRRGSSVAIHSARCQASATATMLPFRS